MAKKAEPVESVAEVLKTDREYLQDQIDELRELYEKCKSFGIRSISDLEVKISYLDRDLNKLN